jgi:glutathione peroxidase
MSTYRNKILLIVNVASECGFTDQYRDLEKLYRKYKSSGLVVLGFPCDQFGHQEPGSSIEIKNFCTTHYQVSFPLFSKICVNGSDESPLFTFLKKQVNDISITKDIEWNFTKFLVDNTGKIIKRYAPNVNPTQIEPDMLISLLHNTLPLKSGS